MKGVLGNKMDELQLFPSLK